MEELKDYNVEFKPDVKIGDFSKDALERLWLAAGKMWVGMDGVWYNLIKERFGESMAMELESEMWRRVVPLEVRLPRKALNILGDDVATVFKVCQVDPGFGGVCDLQCDLKDKSHGILTVKRCLALEYFERHEETARMREACIVVERETLEIYAHCVNPNIKVIPLKLPPRKSKEEIACQWEFYLELKA